MKAMAIKFIIFFFFVLAWKYQCVDNLFMLQDKNCGFVKIQSAILLYNFTFKKKLFWKGALLILNKVLKNLTKFYLNSKKSISDIL